MVRVYAVRFFLSMVKSSKSFFKLRLLSFCIGLIKFYRQYRCYIKKEENPYFKDVEFYPCLEDDISYTPLEPTYFFQDSWAARHIYNLKPSHHYDVGSSAKTMGILSQFVPITMIDIRPIELELKDLHFKKGSILNLPFINNSLSSLSSLCVVEHIGLGRYGDDIDPFGSEKAIRELKRVLKIGGTLLLSVPVDNANKIYFNAHRAFTRDYIFELFEGFDVVDEKYHYEKKIYDEYDAAKGFGTGLFLLKKI